MKTIVVIDTNVLLSDPNVLFVYADAEIIIPQIVLSELDKVKVARNDREVKWRGREISRILFELSEYGNLTEGIPLDNNSIVRVVSSSSEGFPENLNRKNADDRILGSALQVKSKHPDARVVVLTNDLNMLLKAQTLGIEILHHQNQFKPGLWRRLTGKLGSKRLPMGWLMLPFVLIAVFFALWLYVPSPIPTSAEPPVLNTSLYELKEIGYLDALKKNPNDFHTLFQLGELYLNWAQQLQSNAKFDDEREKLNDAVDAFNRSLIINPKNAVARTDLGNAYYFLGNINAAIEQYTLGVVSDPDYALAHFDLGFVLYNHLGNASEAAKQFELYLKLAPTGKQSTYAQQKLKEIKADTQVAPQ